MKKLREYILENVITGERVTVKTFNHIELVGQTVRFKNWDWLPFQRKMVVVEIIKSNSFMEPDLVHLIDRKNQLAPSFLIIINSSNPSNPN